MKKENAEFHAETRSSRRESNPPTSAFSAPPREKKAGWETKTIGDVCDVMNGGTPKTGVPEYWDGKQPCECERKSKVKVKLADGKARTIQHMTMTSFWHADGTPMSSQLFMEILFGKLPDFFKDEEELRTLWSTPSTRATLLEGLAEAGFGYEQMTEMQKIIEAEKSDLFDVLAYVAYAMPPLTREDRASKAKVKISSQFNPKQQAFLDFVLSH